MDTEKYKEISRLLVQLTVEEFREILVEAMGVVSSPSVCLTPQPTRCQGIRGLAEALSCSSTTIYGLLKAGVLDDAIVSHIGRAYVFDVELARARANIYITEKAAVPRQPSPSPAASPAPTPEVVGYEQGSLFQ